MSASNPFDRFELDPSSDLQAITEALRSRTADASPAERVELRGAWEALTRHPTHRLELALSAVPETRPPLGRPPAVLRPAARSLPQDREPITLSDLVDTQPVEEALPRPDEAELALWRPASSRDGAT